MFTFLFIAWVCGAQWIAFHTRFYELKLLPTHSSLPRFTKASLALPFVSAKKVLLAFAVYMGSIGLTFFTLFLLHRNLTLTTSLICAVQALFFFLGFCALFYFISGKQKQNTEKKLIFLIWKSPSPYLLEKPFLSWKKDFLYGSATWFLSFPLATFVGECADGLLSHYFDLPPYEQVAVLFLKAAMKSPVALWCAFSTIIVIIPFLEELLFRAVLQTYLRSLFGPKAAIFVSSFCFSMAHFAASQQMGNISLLLSLFILGGYLGFLYEKRRSLWASIGLHVTFNAISGLRIVLFP